MLARYGVEHSMQSRTIHERQQKTGFRTRDVTIEGRAFTSLRGYEPEALKWLVHSGVPVKSLAVKAAEGVPAIQWIDKTGRNHYYHPDAFVKRRNLIIEVKSKYTLGIGNAESMFYMTRRKLRACEALGYKVCLLVVDQGRVVKIEQWNQKRSQVAHLVQAALEAETHPQESRPRARKRSA
jgi:hypothetical protein